jgi:hypothetical protein
VALKEASREPAGRSLSNPCFQEQVRTQAATEAASWATSLPQRRTEHRKRCKDSAKHAKRVRTELVALETELTRVA